MLSAIHRALVHLPIGFFLLVLLVEWVAWRQNKIRKNNSASPANARQWLGWMWMALAGSSIIALISGTLLQNSGYYAGETFTLHRLTAYAFTILSCLVGINHQYRVFGDKISLLLKIIMVPLVMLAGHAGGELSAGPELLAIVPEPELPSLSTEDTVQIYPHLIQSIFETKCIRCHHQGNARGGVSMDSPAALLTDSLGDPVIYPGDLERSLGYQRMILSPWDHRVMPPSGPPLTYHEKRLVEWWIMENAPFEASLADLNLPEDILHLLQNTFDYRTQNRAFYEKVKAAPIDSNAWRAVAAAGWNISRLAQHNHFLDVHRKGRLDSLSLDDWHALEPIAANIVWLDLSNQTVPAAAFNLIGEMPNLYRLQLQNTNTRDGDLKSLMGLEHLHTLNLFGSPITDESIPYLIEMPAMQRLFIGKTPLQELGMDSVAQFLPGISVN